MSDASRLAVALNGYGLEGPDGSREVLPWYEVASLARFSEELEYESVYAPEIAGWEAFALLSAIAGVTERVGLVTGVVPLGARDPQRLAMATASLQEVSAGRFTLGVGSREPMEATGARLGELRELIARGRSTDWAHAPRPAPIFLAALGPRMTELAGELADGVILNWCTPERVAAARAAIPRREGFTIAVYVRACLSHVDEQADEALRVAASRYASMGPYRGQFEAMGVDPSDPMEVAARTCVRGDATSARRRLREYSEAGADVVVVYPVAAGEAASSLTGTLMAAAPGGGAKSAVEVDSGSHD
ncbi:MAG: LLM class flavin-dependent oxidoreductase [Actinobacteria bacterium]|nr:LLM class flavin-dependent oxidoreductase [Actinomycetota bacterium]